MPNLVDAIYAKPSDEIGRAATVTVSTATADSHYPVINVQTFEPWKPFLTSSSGTAVEIDFDHGSAKDVPIVSVHQHNLPAGTVINVQRGSSQGATTINTAHTVLAHPNTGLPLPIGIDVTGDGGYNGATGFRWTRLHVPSLAQKVGFGSVLVWNAKRQDIRNVKYPVADKPNHPKRVFKTAFGGKSTYYMRIRMRTQPVDFLFHSDAEWAAFYALFNDCQNGTNAFLWWRDPTGSDAWLGAFPEDDLLHQLLVNPRHGVATTIEELGSGKALPT